MSGGAHARSSRLRRDDGTSEDPHAVVGPSDAQLLADVRAGDESAYDTLWRRHERAARNFARSLVRPSDADELVSEGFYRVLRALRQGGGPDGAFRTYLLTTIRRANIDLGRGYLNRVLLTDDPANLEVDYAPSAADEVLDQDQSSAAWRAWASLPDDARTLLWHSIVEEESPAQIAPLLGISANGVASRTVRAREKLREAFLDQHVQEADSQQCCYTRDRLGRYTRNGLSERERATVDEHLKQCSRCKGAYAQIIDLNFAMRAGIVPVVIGGAAAAKYLGGVHLWWLPWRHTSGARSPGSRSVAGAAAVAVVIAVAAAAALIARQVADSSASHPKAAGDPVSRPPAQVIAPPRPSAHPSVRRAAPPEPTRHTHPRSTPRTTTPAPTPTTTTSATHHVSAKTHRPRSTPRPTPTASSPRPSTPKSPPPPTTTTKTVTVTLTGADGSPGWLTATTDQPWTITSITGPARANCRVRSADEAACLLVLPDASAQTFLVTVAGPSDATGVLHATYDSSAEPPVSHDYPI